MIGFDEKFSTFPDYILGITREIWEQRGIATLHHYYAPDIIVRSPASIVTGNQGVIAATMATLAEFPDRELLGEDVIWCGTPESGMLSSHRILSSATHTRDGVYGTASGYPLRYRVIADCHAINNQINDEWLIRDQTAIVQQLGQTAQDYARELIHREGGPQHCVAPLCAANDIPGPYTGRGNDSRWGSQFADTLQRMMNAEFSVIASSYDRAASLEYPGGQTSWSHRGVDAFWMGLRAAFPSAQFNIEHCMGREDPLMPPRAAIRWSLSGKHDGWGSFGAPTGSDVYILGASHVEFGQLASGEPQIRREWTLLDETAVWKQILMQTGDL